MRPFVVRSFLVDEASANSVSLGCRCDKPQVESERARDAGFGMPGAGLVVCWGGTTKCAKCAKGLLGFLLVDCGGERGFGRLGQGQGGVQTKRMDE